MIHKELAQRVLVAAVGIPLAVVAMYIGGYALGGVLGVIAALSAREFYALATSRGDDPYTVFGMIGSALLVVVASGVPSEASATPLFWAIALALFLITASAALWTRPAERDPLSAAAITVAGAVYTGGTLAYALFLRHAPHTDGMSASAALAGTALLAFPVAMTWINDSLAYFAGRALGRRKLIPRVSPGKTVEGAIAGLVGTTLVGGLYAAFVLQAWTGWPVPVLGGAAVALVLAAAAQVGDLVESLLKRSAGVKDSGALIPGHGGVLDRFDALFFTLPIGYWCLRLVMGSATPL
ncbi:MAG: phosphatidate cytidylyltransferase [Longimicrobiales bacterium]